MRLRAFLRSVDSGAFHFPVRAILLALVVARLPVSSLPFLRMSHAESLACA